MPESQTLSIDESRLERAVLHIARCTLEARTPLSLGTGNPDGVFDTALVTDTNKLPAIPATGLTGALRQLWRDSHDDDGSDKRLFGDQQRDLGNPSHVAVSWGVLLDASDKAVEGLRPHSEFDDLLDYAHALAEEPQFRNRVKISHQGAAADTGKFDRAILPAGYRFAVEIRLWSERSDNLDWQQLLNLLAHPGFRLGGATRAGLGRMALVSCHENSFDMRQPARASAYAKLSHEIDNTEGLNTYQPGSLSHGLINGTLTLTPQGLWRIGQGDVDLRDNPAKAAKLIPVSEITVDRDDKKAKPGKRKLLLPASSLKGALAHRMAFHANRLQARWAEEQPANDKNQRPPEVDALFGKIKHSDTESGHIGALLIDDVYIDYQQSDLVEVMHNSIDRFTGGVRRHVLFSELSVHSPGKQIPIDISIDTTRIKADDAQLPIIRAAFSAALDDLCKGRLALGSRGSSGNGFFSGEPSAELASWLASDTKQEAAA